MKRVPMDYLRKNTKKIIKDNKARERRIDKTTKLFATKVAKRKSST